MIENKSSNNNIKKRINFDEPIADMIERLKSEHRNFETKLQEIEDAINNSNKDKDIVNATKIINKKHE
jgi:hypothetical protein